MGTLRHWDHGNAPMGGATGDAIRDAMFGVYAVDGAHFGVGEDQPISRFSLRTVGEQEALCVAFGDGVELVITRE